jgi:hypothetical protein
VTENGRHFSFILCTDIIAKQPSEKVKTLINLMEQEEAGTVEKISNAQEINKTIKRRS